MPECVPPKPLDANSFSLGFENVPLNDASVEATPGDVGRENKPLRAVTLHLEEDIGECRIKRNFVV